MIKELRAKHLKKFWSGGDPIVHGGGLKFSWMGGTGFDGGGQPLHGVWSPPIPPMLASPDVYEYLLFCVCVLHI